MSREDKIPRNLKILNHWIAELRDLASQKQLMFYADNKLHPFTRKDIEDFFCAHNFGDDFKEGLSPDEALSNEIECWENEMEAA